MYNVSTWVVIRIYWKIYVPRASGPLDYIFQYIRITTHVLYQYIHNFFCLLYPLGECPDGWLNAGELGGCYLFAPNGPGLNWQQSVDYCASIGGFLTDILNQETETFLESSGFVESNPDVRWWIGGNDIAQVST